MIRSSGAFEFLNISQTFVESRWRGPKYTAGAHSSLTSVLQGAVWDSHVDEKSLCYSLMKVCVHLRRIFPGNFDDGKPLINS